MTSSRAMSGKAIPEIEITYLRQYLERNSDGVSHNRWNVHYSVDGVKWAKLAVQAQDELGVYKYILSKHKEQDDASVRV